MNDSRSNTAWLLALGSIVAWTGNGRAQAGKSAGNEANAASESPSASTEPPAISEPPATAPAKPEQAKSGSAKKKEKDSSDQSSGEADSGNAQEAAPGEVPPVGSSETAGVPAGEVSQPDASSPPAAPAAEAPTTPQSSAPYGPGPYYAPGPGAPAYPYYPFNYPYPYANAYPPPAPAGLGYAPGGSLGVGVGGVAGGVADTGEKQSAGDDDEQGPAGLSVSAGLTTNVGSGTFVTTPFVRNPYVDWSANLSPRYTFPDQTSVSVSIGVTQELTESDGSSDPHQLFLSDIRFGVQRPIYRFEQTKTELSGDAGLSLPTSLASRTETLYTALTAGLRVTQPVEKFKISFRTGARKNFHQYTTPIIDPEADDGLVIAFAREGGNERVSAAAISTGDNNVEWNWSNALSVGYAPFEKWSFNASYTLAHSWTYESFPLDELSGVGARAGRGRRDSSGATLSASYQLMEQVGLAAGFQSVSTPRGADGQSIRFPFYEFRGTALNLNTVFMSVTFTEPIPL